MTQSGLHVASPSWSCWPGGQVSPPLPEEPPALLLVTPEVPDAAAVADVPDAAPREDDDGSAPVDVPSDDPWLAEEELEKETAPEALLARLVAGAPEVAAPRDDAEALVGPSPDRLLLRLPDGEPTEEAWDEVEPAAAPPSSDDEGGPVRHLPLTHSCPFRQSASVSHAADSRHPAARLAITITAAPRGSAFALHAMNLSCQETMKTNTTPPAPMAAMARNTRPPSAAVPKPTKMAVCMGC